MASIFSSGRKKITLEPMDVALIFKEDGHVDLSFPEISEDDVPPHVMAALALSYAVMDEEFFLMMQDRFAQKATEELINAKATPEAPETMTPVSLDEPQKTGASPPNLTIVS